jgi:exodeoxyribonuclease VII small subunit
MPKQEAANNTDLSFEQAIAELELIVSQLEKGDVPLEQSIVLYTRGEALKARCELLLRSAESRIEKITFDASNAPSKAVAADFS